MEGYQSQELPGALGPSRISPAASGKKKERLPEGDVVLY